MIVDGPRPAVEWVTSLPSAWLTSADRHVLLMLALLSRDGRHASPSLEELVRLLGERSKGTLMDRLDRLAEPNLLRPALLRVRRGRGRRRNRYTLKTGIR